MRKPHQIMVRGERYVPVVLLVTGRTAEGLPRECRFIADDERVKIQGGEEFIVCYALESVMRKPS